MTDIMAASRGSIPGRPSRCRFASHNAPKPASIVSMRRYFAVRPQFWLGLQRDYDVMTFDASQIGPIVPLTAARLPKHESGAVEFDGAVALHISVDFHQPVNMAGLAAVCRAAGRRRGEPQRARKRQARDHARAIAAG